MERLVLVEGVSYAGWLRTTEAAQMLRVSSAEYAGRSHTGYVLMHEVAQLRANTVRRLRHRQEYRQHELGEEAEWLSRKEAAALLYVAEHRISKLAEKRTLRSKTERRGTKAHRLFVLKVDVERLTDNPEHLRRKFLWERDRKWAEHTPYPEEGVEPEGDYVTSADVAIWLGVSVSTVSMWRKTGRLRCELQRGKGGKKWHRKADVLELLANPEFQKHRAQWKQTVAAAKEPKPSAAFRVLKTDREFRTLSLGVPELW